MLPNDLSCEKAQHEEKSANFGTKVPVKRRKTGSFSAKVAHLRTPLGFPPSELPFHGLIRPRFLRPVRTSARSLRTSTCRCGRCLGQATRCHAKCSRRSHGEGRSLGIARPHARRHPVHRRQLGKNAAHDREADQKMPLDKTRARVRRFEPRKRPHRRSTAFCGMPKDGREMIEQYHASAQGHV